jgi:hypothetical protein
MSARLRIGSGAGGARPFALPADVATMAVAVMGIRGSGKTVTAKDLVEELLAQGHQVVVIDPTNVWWGLKSSADGEGPGYPVAILGGPQGDLPLAADTGAAIADFVVDHHLSVVLSFRHLRKGAQQGFVTAFVEQLYHRKGESEHRTPVTVVIDEASQYVPQRVGASEARMVGAIQDIARLGRSSGLGLILVDQRPASVNKDVLTQAEVLIAHRVTAPQDRKALDDWISQHDTEGHRGVFLEGLASLPRGVAWVWSPLLDLFERVQVRAPRTFDSSATPEMGEVTTAPATLATVDLGPLRAALADAVAAAEARDPKHLQARIAELEKQLAGKAPADPARAAMEAQLVAEYAALSDRAAEALELVELAGDSVRSALSNAAEVVADLRRLATARAGLSAAAAPALQSTPSKAASAAPARSITPPRTVRGTAAAAPATKSSPAPAAGTLPAAQQRILDALATYEGFGQFRAEREAVAAVAGYRLGGAFNVATARLRDFGLIAPTAGGMALTDEGRALANARHFKSRRDVHRAWMELLSSAEQRVLQVLIDAYPASIDRATLAEGSGFRPGGAFNVAAAGLKKRGAAVATSAGLQASALLFPKGLRA